MTAFQLQLYINMFAMLYLAVTFPVVDGLDGFIYLSRNSTILSYIIVFSFCSSIGQIFIFYTLTNFGCVAAADHDDLSCPTHSPPLPPPPPTPPHPHRSHTHLKKIQHHNAGH